VNVLSAAFGADFEVEDDGTLNAGLTGFFGVGRFDRVDRPRGRDVAANLVKRLVGEGELARDQSATGNTQAENSVRMLPVYAAQAAHGTMNL